MTQDKIYDKCKYINNISKPRFTSGAQIKVNLFGGRPV